MLKYITCVFFYYLLKNVYSSNGIQGTRLRLYIGDKKGEFMNILSQYLPFLTGSYYGYCSTFTEDEMTKNMGFFFIA